MTATGTVYGLVDPRNGNVRYVGQTVQTLAQRLGGKYAPRVREWMAGLRAADLAPLIIALRENVPVAELRAAETDEITRIIATGAELLNEQSTGPGREANHQRLKAERIAGWGELANIAVDTLGGPLPPGDLPAMVSAKGACSDLRGLAGSRFNEYLDQSFYVATQMDYASEQDRARFLSLAVWYAVAVYPWHRLAEVGGLCSDDASFIAWAARDARTKEALEFLAAYGDRVLARLSTGWYSPIRRGRTPGDLLGVVAVAYSGGMPPEATRSDVIDVLSELANDHQLTQPMADLLMQLDPRALDSVFGKDIAARIDGDLDLAAGTAGRVLQELTKHFHIYDGPVKRAIDRSTQTFPVVTLPDYSTWSGPGVPAARVASASLVRAGLAAPDRMSAEEYLAAVRDLWTPLPDDRRRQEAA